MEEPAFIFSNLCLGGKMKKFLRTLVIFVVCLNVAVSSDDLKKCDSGCNWPVNLAVGLGTVVGGKLFSVGIDSLNRDETAEIEKRRRVNMATGGYECISYKGGAPECYPYRLEIERGIYGGESERTKRNLLRVCGEGVKPWCHFKVSNDVLGFDEGTGSAVDPQKGKAKFLEVMYRCVAPVGGRVIGHKEQKFKEGESVILDCAEHFKTIFREK